MSADGLPRIKRYTKWVERGRMGPSGMYDDSFSAPGIIMSEQIGNVVDHDLRCALRLADVVQALGLLERPRWGGYPGGVEVIRGEPHRCISARDLPIQAVYDEFPDDIHEMLKQWLINENHKHNSTDS